MFVSMKELLLKAQQNKYAIPHFNINNLEWTKYILEVCENEKTPVILGVSEGSIHYMGGYYTVSNMVQGLIQDLKITIPVVLHLDHGSSISSCQDACDAGFTSVMIDASKNPLYENIRKTKEVVLYAHAKGISVEAEIGHIGTETADKSLYADVEECALFVNQTGIDALAPAIGSAHGLYKGEPCLDFERLKEISEKTKIPLVLHGGTGIPDSLIEKAITYGICKININTELQVVWNKAIRKYIEEHATIYDPRKIIESGKESMQKAIYTKIKLLKNSFQ